MIKSKVSFIKTIMRKEIKAFKIPENKEGAEYRGAQHEGTGLHIGVALSIIRDCKGVSITDISRSLDISPEEVVHAESEAFWDEGLLRKYASELRITPDEVLALAAFPTMLGSDDDPIGLRFRHLRKMLKIARNVMADRMQCHRQHITDLESSKKLHLQVVYKITRIIEITIPQLLGREEIEMVGSKSKPAGPEIKTMRLAKGAKIMAFAQRAGFSLRYYRVIEQSDQIPERFYHRITKALSEYASDILHPGESVADRWVFPPKGHVGSKIRTTRLSKYLTVKQLAKKAGYSIGSVDKMERSETVKKGALQTMAQAMRTTIQEILDAPDADEIELFGSEEMPIGKQFETVRLHLKLTAREIARRIRMQPQNYFDVEGQMAQCTITMLSRVAGGLRVTNEYVLNFRQDDIL